MTGSGFARGLAVLAVLGLAQAASAVLVGFEEAFPAPAELDPVGGSVVVTTGPVAFAANGFSGTVTSTVITGDTTNVLGGLTFVYQITNDAPSSAGLGRLTVPGFNGFLTDMSYQIGFPSEQVPTLVGRNLNGNSVSFTFTAPPTGLGLISPGETTSLLVVQTNATTYAPTVVNLIDGDIAQATGYAPIPEPAALSLIGLAGLLATRRRA